MKEKYLEGPNFRNVYYQCFIKLYEYIKLNVVVEQNVK